MAITHVNSQTTSADATLDGARSVTAPSGLAAGDLVVIVVCSNGGSNPNAITFSAGSGFTLKKEFTAVANPKWGLWYKVAGGSEPGTYTLSIPSEAAGSLCAAAFRGIDQNTPWDVTESDINDSAGTPVDVPLIANGSANRMLIVAMGGNSATQTYTPPTESPVWNEAWDLGASRAQTLAYRIDAAGTDGGARTWTASSTSVPRIGMFGALREAAVGQPARKRMGGVQFASATQSGAAGTW